jgi:hypothetical protein
MVKKCLPGEGNFCPPRGSHLRKRAKNEKSPEHHSGPCLILTVPVVISTGAEWRNLNSPAAKNLDIQVLHVQSILFDELPACLDILTHERGEDRFRLSQILELHG